MAVVSCSWVNWVCVVGGGEMEVRESLIDVGGSMFRLGHSRLGGFALFAVYSNYITLLDWTELDGTG
jgi:hypothetical protein